MHFHRWKRRSFITLLGGAAAIWPLAAKAQQPGTMVRIAYVTANSDADQEGQSRRLAFFAALQQLGWTDGHNYRLDFRAGAMQPGTLPGSAAEVVSLAPNVIVAHGTPTAQALRDATRAIPNRFRRCH